MQFYGPRGEVGPITMTILVNRDFFDFEGLTTDLPNLPDLTSRLEDNGFAGTQYQYRTISLADSRNAIPASIGFEDDPAAFVVQLNAAFADDERVLEKLDAL
jgi:hypothetical protein